MLKVNNLCAVCQSIKADPKLLESIFKTKYYLRGSGQSLMSLHDDYKNLFSYKSLRNHCEKHQFMSEDQFTKRHLSTIAKKAEQNIVRRAFESKQVFDDVIGEGMQRLADGEMEINANHLLRAAELKKSFQLKEQDQQLAMMEMVYHFSSGENKESRAYDKRVVEGETVSDYNPTAELADDPERRTVQASTFYQSLTGDAAPPRAN